MANTTNVFEYPVGFKPMYHSIAGSNDTDIVLVDGFNGKLISFNPESKKYGAVISIPKLGRYVSCLMINGNVHIIHGNDNSDNIYLIYSTKTRKVMQFMDTLNHPRMGYVAFTRGTVQGDLCGDASIESVELFKRIKRIGTSEFYKFGGFNWDDWKCDDSFYIGTLQNGDARKPINWREAPLYTLLEPLSNCGYIQMDSIIVTFGGCTDVHSFLDDIYILDIHIDHKNGWIRSPIKCPKEGTFTAVLDHNYIVHLFTHCNDDKHHRYMALNHAVDGLLTRKTKKADEDRKRMKEEKLLVIQRHELLEKSQGLAEDIKRLKQEIESLKKDRKLSGKQMTALQKAKDDLLQTQKGLRSEKRKLTKQNKGLRKSVDNWKSKNKVIEGKVKSHDSEQKEAQMQIESLQNEVERLKKENEVFIGKQKESRKQVAALQKKNADLRSQKKKDAADLKGKRKKEKEPQSEIASLKQQVRVIKEQNKVLNGYREEWQKMVAENQRLTVSLAAHREEVNKWKREKKQWESKVNGLLRNDERWRKENDSLNREQMLLQSTINELRNKVKEMELNALNPSEFMKWDWKQIHQWIMELEGGRFKKYQTVLKNALSDDEMMGEDLLDVTPLVIKLWGIKDRKDSKGLSKYIQDLVEQNNSYQNEGVPSAYD